MNNCRAETNEDDMAGRKRRIRTKRGTPAYVQRLRERRRVQRINNRCASAFLNQHNRHNSLDRDQRVLGNHGRDSQVSSKRRIRNREKNIKRREKRKVKLRILETLNRQQLHLPPRLDSQTTSTSASPSSSSPTPMGPANRARRGPSLGRFNHNFQLSTFNIRTLAGAHKLNELYNIMNKKQISILLLQETKQIHHAGEGPIRDYTTADGYRVIHTSAVKGNHGHGASGGLAFIISPQNAPNISCSNIISPRIFYIKIIQQIKEVNQTLHIYNVYAPGALAVNAGATSEFYLQLSSAIRNHPNRDMLIIAGDFNAVLLPTSPDVLFSPSQSSANSNTPHLEQFLIEESFLAINTRFKKSNSQLNTFYGPKQRKQRLDHILIPKKWQTTFSDFNTRRAPFSADHKILSATGKFRFQVHKKIPKQPQTDWTALQNSDLQEQITQHITGQLTSTGDLNIDYQLFVSATLSACSILPKIERQQRICPWKDSKILELRMQLNIARAIYNLQRNPRHFKALRLAGFQLASQYTANQQQYLLAQCKDIEQLREDHKHKAAWNLINIISSRKMRSRGVVQANSPTERLGKWKAHFERVFATTTSTAPPSPLTPSISSSAPSTPAAHTNNISTTIPNTFQTRSTLTQSQSNSQYSTIAPLAPLAHPPLPTLMAIFSTQEINKMHHEFDTSPISEFELTYALKHIRNGKACGVDAITAEILKLPGLAQILTTMLNQAFDTGTIPDLWHIQLLIPVPKKGDLSLCDNYRGIALMSITAKLYNKILFYRLSAVLNKRLRPSQNGFRPHRSTTQHILALRILIEASKDHVACPLAIAFIDFSKAFDSIRWDYLEAILALYAVPPKLIRAIMSVYKGTSAQVRTSDGTSDPFLLLQGVLQGDTLAPFLFIIVLDYVLRQAIQDPSLGFKINAGSRRTSKYITDLTYADDIAAISSSAANLQALLLAIERAAQPVGLFINRPKTEAIFYPTSLTPTEPLHISSGPIKWVKDFKYLGGLVTSALTDMKKRLHQAWDAARSTRKLWKSALDDHTKAQLFQSLIGSIALYGSETWTLTKTQRTTFFSGYNSLLRYCLNIHYSTHTKTEVVYARANISRPACVLAKRSLKFVHRTLTGPSQPAKDTLQWQHTLTRNTRSKRKRSYHEQLLIFDGINVLDLTPANKRTRIQENINNLVDPKYVKALIDSYSPNLGSYEALLSDSDSDSDDDTMAVA